MVSGAEGFKYLIFIIIHFFNYNKINIVEFAMSQFFFTSVLRSEFVKI